MAQQQSDGVPGDAFAFTGSWREYLPIAASNFLLTIVTLGIYRFWAKARERRYLWSRTVFIDDRLEWSGTGKEMFVGFMFALLVAGIPLLVLNLIAQGLVLRGQAGLGALVFFFLYLFLGLLFGFARFRALRYRLSRSWWHGVRGGSDVKGGAYAWSYVWKTVCGGIAFGFLIPWSMCELWNERWNAMSFGPSEFSASAYPSGLKRYWALILLSPLAMGAVVMAIVAVFGAGAGILGVLATYVGWVLVGSFFYSAFLRRAIGTLELGELQFTFDADGWDLLKLLLGDIGLVLVTLGFGIMFIGYRHWTFLVAHLGAVGTVDLAGLTQSTTRAPREAEGFADAFDIGAI